jgi:prepilin-type N-terminal cleavage/methylation domain-containing protein/prepilin-type processing-associated H-X9-DG protein
LQEASHRLFFCPEFTCLILPSPKIAGRVNTTHKRVRRTRFRGWEARDCAKNAAVSFMLKAIDTMKLAFTRAAGAFSLVEMLVVIAIISILAALLLPALEQGKFRARRVECVSNLQEVGIATHSFANDHGGKFPTQVSTNDGGSLEFVMAGYRVFNHEFYFSFRHFRPLAGELGTPKLLVCPSDLLRQPATDFGQFDNRNLSYVIGLVADPGNPLAILAADRGLPARPLPGYGITSIVRIPPSSAYRNWAGVHNRTGNILFTDGHVEESSDGIILIEESVPEDLVYPDVPDLAANPPTAGPGNGTPNDNPPPSGNPPSGNPGPNNAAGNGPNPANPPGPNASSPVHPAGFSGQHGTGIVPPESPPTIDETASNPPLLTPASAISTNTVTEPDSSDDMSVFDRQIYRIVHRAFGWLYLLALLFLLLFLILRLWRAWKRRQERREG